MIKIMFVLRFSAFLILCVFIIGCGGTQQTPTYEAQGKVAFPDGTPLTSGVVQFKPVNSEHSFTARGQIQPDGSFVLGTFDLGDGAIEGEHVALVMPIIRIPSTQAHKLAPKQTRVIDEKYSRFETSGLKFTVNRNAEENQFKIVVTSPVNW